MITDANCDLRSLTDFNAVDNVAVPALRIGKCGDENRVAGLDGSQHRF